MHVEVVEPTEYTVEACSGLPLLRNAKLKNWGITCITAITFRGFKQDKFIQRPDGSHRFLTCILTEEVDWATLNGWQLGTYLRFAYFAVDVVTLQIDL